VIRYVDPAPGKRSYNHYVTFRNRQFVTKVIPDLVRESDLVQVSLIEALNQVGNLSAYFYYPVVS
jgi:hypothetical protein